MVDDRPMTTGEGSYLSQNDAIMWNVEADPLLRSTIAVIFLLDRTPNREVLEARVRRTIGDVLALRQRVEGVPLHPGSLQWVEVDEVDLGYHLRHVSLPDPGGTDELLEFARTTAAGGFDPARPLWSFTLVDHVRVDGENRAAFIMTAHHVVTDGIGAIALAAHLFDLTADATAPDDTGAVTALPAQPAPTSTLDRWLRAVAHDVETAASIAATGMHDAVPNMLNALRHPVDTVAGVAATVQSVARVVVPTVDTKSPVMTARTMVHRFSVLEVPVDVLRAAGKAGGGTLNDAFLAGITGGMRRYHQLHDAPVTELRMAMPISLRTDDHAAGGNHVTVLRTVVPIDVADPRDRIAQLHEVGRRLRDERSLAHTEAIAGVLNLLPRGVIGTMLKRVDFLASNVPGVPVPLYLAGSEVLRVFPFGPTAGSSVNLTLMSYRGQCGIGIHTDTAAIPDTDVFVRCITEGFDEVTSLATR